LAPPSIFRLKPEATTIGLATSRAAEVSCFGLAAGHAVTRHNHAVVLRRQPMGIRR
jgi:hypothetical protein